MSQQISVSPPPPPQPGVNGNQSQLQAPPVDVTDSLVYKNRLHTYAAKLGLPAPVYVAQNEGVAHAPLFRVTVFVDNTHYTSQKLFTNKRYAEQETARVALDALFNKVTDDQQGFLFINEDTIFCKSVLNEYAAKMHLDKPTYQTTTHQLYGVVAFTSSLFFKGVTFTSQVARNKKDAEQLAARAAILSILGTPGPDSTVISNIIKSKYKPYAAVYLGNNSTAPNVTPVPLNSLIFPNVTLMSNDTGLNLGSLLNKGKEVTTTEITNNVATGAVIGNPSNHISTVHVQYQPEHQFKRPILDTPTAPTPPMPSVDEPNSSKKRRKNKKKKHEPVAQPVVGNGSTTPQVMPMSNDTGLNSSSSLNKGKEVTTTETINDVAKGALIENPSGYIATIQAQNQPNLDTPAAPVISPVPPAHEYYTVSTSNSSKKRRKNQKKKHQPVALPVVHNEGAIQGPLINKGKEHEVMAGSERENQLGKTAFIRIWNNPYHEPKKPKIDAPPSEDMFGSPTRVGPSSKKRRKKGKKVIQSIAQFPQPIMPASQVPCSVPQ